LRKDKNQLIDIPEGTKEAFGQFIYKIIERLENSKIKKERKVNINKARKDFFKNQKNQSITPDKFTNPKLTLDEAKNMLIGKTIEDIYYNKDETCLVMVVDGLKIGIWDSEQYFTDFGFSIEGKEVVAKRIVKGG